MDTVSTLFQKASNDYIDSIELTGNLIKWDVHVGDGDGDGEIKLNKLEVFKKINTKWESINTKIVDYPYTKIIASSLLKNNDIVILTTSGIFIYTFSEKDKSIFLNYFYFMDLKRYSPNLGKYMKLLQHYKRIFSKYTLPLPNYDSFRLDGWVSNVMNNKSSFLKCGVELLKFAIKEHNHF
ncbi:hypothetical protein RhiirA1_479181 [Rhizophagus irregularis]|uniref:Uncharacterized protein n=1 Tax=Rhizophagus irregularis TaxID=588596 RepID=A0A2N0QR18_9GLOM|nr:hypothetical protein RhiirA1_479181 [Rhizophagus irregularis]